MAYKSIIKRRHTRNLWRRKNPSRVREYNKKQREKNPLYLCACGCGKKIRTGKYYRGHSPKIHTIFRAKNLKIKNKGKGWIDHCGYRILKRDGKDIREHRYLMEQHLGRKLDLSEHIHHKNGNRLDNRIENLEIMTNSEHNSRHISKHITKEIKKLVLDRLEKGISLRKSIEGTPVRSTATPYRWKKLYVQSF